MAKEEAFANSSTPQHLTSHSARPFVQPGTVANRIQAYNDKSNNSNSTARVSKPDNVQRLLTRLRQHRGVKDESSTLNTGLNPANGPASSSRPLAAEPNFLSIYGKRQGGGWASPAGRRISVRGQDIPVDLYVGVDNTDWPRKNTGVLRPTGHIGGQSSAPLDIIVPRLGKAVSNDRFEKVRVVRDAVDGPKVHLNSAHPTEVDVLPLQGISEDIVHPGAEGRMGNEIDASRRSSAISTGRDVSISSELPEALITKARRGTLGTSLYSTDTGHVPGGGFGTDIELMNLTGRAPSSFRDDISFKRPYRSGDLKSYSASYPSRGSSSRRSEPEGGPLTFPGTGEDSGIVLGQTTDSQLVTSREIYPVPVPGMYRPETLSDGRREVDQASRSDHNRPSFNRQGTPTSNFKHAPSKSSLGEHERPIRPKVSKLPRHSASVASLNAVLQRHNSREMMKASTWSDPAITKSSSRRFSLFGFLPSLFSWNEQQDGSKPKETVPASEAGTGTAAKFHEAGSDPAVIAETPRAIADEAEGENAPASQRPSHSATQYERSEYASTDRSRGRRNQPVEAVHHLMGPEPGQRISSIETPTGLAALQLAAENTTMSNRELGTLPDEGSEQAWTEITGPAHTDDVSQSTETRGRARRRPGSTTPRGGPPDSSQSEHHAVTALFRSTSAIQGHSQSVARSRRVCVVIDAKEDVEFVVSVKIQPHVATPHASN